MPKSRPPRNAPLDLIREHSRHWRENRYVYPVISRRSRGLSIGVNLNPDTACNFDCIYCQVDRGNPDRGARVELEALEAELKEMLDLAVSGDLYDDPHFAGAPRWLRGLRDIAFSGDGEPTTSPRFPDSVVLTARLKKQFGLDAVKIVLITDACYLTKPGVREALAVMDENQGEIWAKLDAGTQEYYRRINRPNLPLNVVLENILDAARVRPVVIQSLWMQVDGEPPPDAEIQAFAGRLNDLRRGGGQIKLVQVYTVARTPAEPYVTPLRREQVEAIAARVREDTGLAVETYSAS